MNGEKTYKINCQDCSWIVLMKAEKNRADYLAEKLKAVQAENCLLKEALRKMC